MTNPKPMHAAYPSRETERNDRPQHATFQLVSSPSSGRHMCYMALCPADMSKPPFHGNNEGNDKLTLSQCEQSKIVECPCQCFLFLNHLYKTWTALGQGEEKEGAAVRSVWQYFFHVHIRLPKTAKVQDVPVCDLEEAIPQCQVSLHLTLVSLGRTQELPPIPSAPRPIPKRPMDWAGRGRNTEEMEGTWNTGIRKVPELSKTLSEPK